MLAIQFTYCTLEVIHYVSFSPPVLFPVQAGPSLPLPPNTVTLTKRFRVTYSLNLLSLQLLWFHIHDKEVRCITSVCKIQSQSYNSLTIVPVALSQNTQYFSIPSIVCGSHEIKGECLEEAVFGWTLKKGAGYLQRCGERASRKKQ